MAAVMATECQGYDRHSVALPFSFFLREAHLPIELQPATIFHTLVPPAVLMAPGRPPSIVPDSAIQIALPEAVTARGLRRPRQPRPARWLLFDVKTIHAGSEHYYSAHARDEQSGAVRHREHDVFPGYVRHARALDAQYSPPGTTPIEDRLRSYTRTRGLVFGAYGEASADVHSLISTAADELAQQQWRLAGARTAAEMRSYVVSLLRRRVGLATVQAMARHRLAREPYIGLERAHVEARMRRGEPQGVPFAYPAPQFGQLPPAIVHVPHGVGG